MIRLIVRNLRQQVAFLRLRSAMRRIRRWREDQQSQQRLWAQLRQGWGNAGWSAPAEYLTILRELASGTEGPILECGSGATTLLLAAMGKEVWSLEHNREWQEHVIDQARRLRVKVRVINAPLRSYGSFDWYGVSAQEMPKFALVVCDGPPSDTRGGRYGLLPVLGERLTPGALILLDDAGRAEEQEIMRRWQIEFGSVTESLSDRYALLRVPSIFAASAHQ